MGLIIYEPYFECFNPSPNNNTYKNYSMYINDDNYIECDSYIGFSYKGNVPIFFLIISIIGFILNLLLIKDFIKTTNNNSRKQSSMKKLFTVLPILDCITCIYWIISSTAFKKPEYIWDYKDPCALLSIIYFSVFTFEFIFINFILIHFRKISLNPIEGILKPGKNIKIYISCSLILTLLIIGIAMGLQILGRSPMNTCFINTQQSGQKGLIFLIPIISTILVIVQVIYDLKCRQMFINDKQVREAYKVNSMYILLFSLLHLPLFILIIFTSSKDSEIGKGQKNFTFFTTLVTCSIPMIVGIIRNCRGFTKIRKIKELTRKFTRSITGNKNIPAYNRSFSKSLNETLTPEDQFDWLERHAMQFFMRDILISVAHCIYSDKSYGKNIYLQDLNKENEAFIKHNIAFDNFRLDDLTVLQSEYLDVTVIEYAPKIFAYLRNLESIDIDSMAESFLPKNNKNGISESQGKSGSFFISTDDNQYMIKTLRVDEFDLIRKTFLNEYVSYITKNTSSLLCRIYGMYNIILNQGDEVLIIVMRNVIGEFKNNIIAQYDLKGSSANRIANFNMEKSSSSTMKDLNFNEYERGIMISRDNIRRFRKIIKYDSIFLSQMELMDYSLFLVKLTLSKEQAADLFGDEIREKQDSAFSELMVENSIKPSMSLMNGGQSLKINLENLNVDELKPKKSLHEKGEIFRHTKYYKHFLFPSLSPGSAYILAIIDYFQIFNFFKYVESGLKTKFGQKKDKVSCVDPKTYSKRFIKYFEKLTDIKHMLKDGQKPDSSNFNTSSNDEYENDDDKNNISGFSKNDNSDIELETMNNLHIG